MNFSFSDTTSFTPDEAAVIRHAYILPVVVDFSLVSRYSIVIVVDVEFDVIADSDAISNWLVF